MNKLASIIICVALLLSCTGKAQNQEMSKSNNMNNKEKTLVVFFSHAGENYSVGNIKVGNTKRVADAISELTGAEQFEIVADKNYDMPYMELVNLATKEGENKEFPTYKGKIDNIAQYDTIYVGGPVWWGTYPRVMFTFFRDYDLNGKTLIPFTTHEGSGLGNAASDLKLVYPKAAILDGFSIYGHECQKSDIKDKVARLIKNIESFSPAPSGYVRNNLLNPLFRVGVIK
jgi:flavodoxin